MTGMGSHRRIRLLWGSLAALPAVAFAQTSVITGAITDPDGGAVKDAVIQAKNSATGAVVRAIASPQGEYKLDLPAGTYDLAVFAWSTVHRTFVPAKLVRVRVR